MVVYIFSQLYAYGEIPQIWRVRNIFKDHPLTIITYPLRNYRVDYSLFSFILRNINLIHSTDNELIWFPQDYKNSSIIEDNDFIYVNFETSWLTNLYYRMYQNKTPPFFFSLSNNEKILGEKLKRDFSIPHNAPIITLHVRESGYREQDTNVKKEGFDGPPRNANIENYLPAINYLIDQGFYIVRLGDKTMKPLPDIKKVIDAPFHPLYNSIANIYFISQSKFFICCASGPNTLAELLGIPRLCLNAPIHVVDNIMKNDLYVYKKYYSKKMKRFLSYEEIICSDLIYNTEINDLHIDYVENSPEEILLSVKEMIARLDGHYLAFAELKGLNKYFINIQQKAMTFHKQEYLPLLHLFNESNFPLSVEYLRLNPDLIKKNDNTFRLRIENRENYYNISNPEKIIPISQATDCEIKQVNKISRLIKQYNSKGYRINMPHRNILITGMIGDHIRFIGKCFNKLNNVQYIDSFVQDYSSLPDFFYNDRKKYFREDKMDDSRKMDFIVVRKIYLIHQISRNSQSIKTIINDYGYRIIAIICNPITAIYEWYKAITQKLEFEINDNQINQMLSMLPIESNSLLDKLAVVWNFYAQNLYILKNIIKIYSYEQMLNNSAIVEKDISEYLSLPVLSLNFRFVNNTISEAEKDTELIQQIIESVNKYCTTLSKFGYDNIEKNLQGFWDKGPFPFCRSVHRII